jgi:predicted amidohydrolase
VVELSDARVGLPTCWDQWFPELARAYSLAGAEVLVYPTAIGSEPGHPGFDTEPLWERVIFANGTFMVAVNRFGPEGERDPHVHPPVPLPPQCPRMSRRSRANTASNASRSGTASRANHAAAASSESWSSTSPPGQAPSRTETVSRLCSASL